MYIYTLHILARINCQKPQLKTHSESLKHKKYSLVTIAVWPGRKHLSLTVNAKICLHVYSL